MIVDLTPLIMDMVTILSTGAMIVLAIYYMKSLLNDETKIDLDYYS